MAQPYGRTSANPLSAGPLKAKFDGCISGISHDANLAPLYNATQRFEHLKNTRELTVLISSSPVRAAVAA